MSKRWIKAGSTDQSIDIFVLDSSSTVGAGLTGLVYNTASLVCYYRKGATGTPTALTLATQTVGGAHSDGGFVAVDGTNMPGVYRLDLSDTIVATEGMVTIYLRGATNMAPVVLELECVDVDIYDSVRMGLTALPNAAADAAGGLIVSDAGGLDADALRSDVAAILVDTGTTLDGKIDTIDTVVDAILVDTAEIGVAGAGLTEAGGTGDQFTGIASVGAVAGAVGSVTGNVGGNVVGSVASVTGAVGSVTGNVGGNVTGSVGSVAAGGITAASIATDAIDADAIAASAVTEIQSGLSTLTGADIRTAVGLASANLDTQLTAIDDAVDTEVAAVKAVTDKLDTAMELDGAVYRFTTNALEQAPSGGGGGTDWTADERTAIRSILGVPASGTTPDDPTVGILDTIRDKVDVVDGIVDSILVDTAEIGVAGAGLTNINLPDQTMNITGNITGNVSGSVGSVSNSNSIVQNLLTWDPTTESATPGSVAEILVGIGTNVTTLLSRVTATLFSGITSLGQWLGLIAGKQTGNSTARTELRATGAGSGTYDETTDSLQAIRDRGDAAWTGGGGGSTSVYANAPYTLRAEGQFPTGVVDIVVGTLLTLDLYVTDRDGAPLSLAGSPTITVGVRNATSGATVGSDQTGTVEFARGGICSVDMVAAWSATAGTYRISASIDYGDDVVVAGPLEMIVRSR